MAGMTDADGLHDTRTARDEISLRDLYLVLRRRALAIVAVALVAGVATFVIVSSRPATYVAEATAVVARAPIEMGSASGLRFRPEVDLTFDTYQTLALTRTVLEELLPVHEAGDLARLRSSLALERVAGAVNAASGMLAVAHRVTSSDPRTSAEAANVWARATIDMARRLLLENLDAVEVITGTRLAEARTELEAADRDLEEFRASSGIASLRARVLPSADGAPGLLERAIADLEEEIRGNRLATAQRVAESTALRGIGASGGDGLEVVLLATPEVALSVAGAVASLEAQIAALAAEREALAAELDDLRRRRDADVAALAQATVGVARRERAVEAPLELVTALSSIEPTIAYVAQVAPSGARVLSEAVVPSAPESKRLVLLTLLAMVVAGFAAVVAVLLIEAVKEPRAPRGAAPRRSASTAAPR
jgi:uncharacterized protein involved in exopolysaccharide biosynthesis